MKYRLIAVSIISALAITVLGLELRNANKEITVGESLYSNLFLDYSESILYIKCLDSYMRGDKLSDLCVRLNDEVLDDYKNYQKFGLEDVLDSLLKN